MDRFEFLPSPVDYYTSAHALDKSTFSVHMADHMSMSTQ